MRSLTGIGLIGAGIKQISKEILHLYTDASCGTISAMLGQCNDENHTYMVTGAMLAIKRSKNTE